MLCNQKANVLWNMGLQEKDFRLDRLLQNTYTQIHDKLLNYWSMWLGLLEPCVFPTIQACTEAVEVIFNTITVRTARAYLFEWSVPSCIHSVAPTRGYMYACFQQGCESPLVSTACYIFARLYQYAYVCTTVGIPIYAYIHVCD